MKFIDLEEYRDCKQYFILFDILLKDTIENKEAFLESLGISPSSYRKCRKGELRIGSQIIGLLAKHFDLKIPTDELLDELTKVLNRIYYNMYYKIYTYFDEDLNYIQTLIKEKYTIFPILKLIELYIEFTKDRDANLLLKENMELYLEVKKYKNFFNNSLLDLFETEYLAFESDLTEEDLTKNYDSNLDAYFTLSSRLFRKKRYIESLFFAQKAKALLLEDANIIRFLYLNNIIMACLMNTNNYGECFNVSFKQILTIKSIEKEKQLIEGANKFLNLSLLGLKRYDEVVVNLIDSKELKIVDVSCLLVALFHVNGKKYQECYKTLNTTNLSENSKKYLRCLDKYLRKPSKSLLTELENYDLARYIVKILKNNANN